MHNLSLYAAMNISMTSIASLIFIFFIVKILSIKKKEVCHWIFFSICVLSLLRITNFYLIVIPFFKKSENLGIIAYRIQTITFFFLPTLLSHMFYSLRYQDIKNHISKERLKNFVFFRTPFKLVLFLYLLSLIYYLFALTGFYPIPSEIKIDNDKMYFINNTSSYVYKSVIIFFIFSYIFSIYLLNNFSKTKMINKDMKILNIIKWSYVFVFGYGYIIQFFISLIRPKFFSLAPYLLIYLSIAIYILIKYFNFLRIYSTPQFLNIVNENFSIPFMITDEKGIIIKTNFNNIDNNIFHDKSIYSIFPESSDQIASILKNGKTIKNQNLTLSNSPNHIEIAYTADINPIKDNLQDVIGLFIVLSDYKISLNSFSERERQIILCLTKGFSYKEIAAELNISYNTVNSHTKNIYKKSGVSDRKKLLESLSYNSGCPATSK